MLNERFKQLGFDLISVKEIIDNLSEIQELQTQKLIKATALIEDKQQKYIENVIITFYFLQELNS